MKNILKYYLVHYEKLYVLIVDEKVDLNDMSEMVDLVKPVKLVELFL